MKISDSLIKLGERIGKRRPQWTQSVGGNVSVKDSGQLWIKATGTRLAEMGKPSALAGMKLSSTTELEQILNDIKTETEESLEQRYADWITDHSEQNRASMEAGFHLLLKGKWVLHFHPASALLMVHVLRKYPDVIKYPGLNIAVIGCHLPGLKLTASLQGEKDADIYLLENHGVILQGEDESILEQWQKLEEQFMDRYFPENLKTYRMSETDFISAMNPLKAPLKFYLPDTAVFREELTKYLMADSGEYTLSHKAPGDLKELWALTVFLWRACPGLAEIPEEVFQKVAGLPTEVFRKQKGMA